MDPGAKHLYGHGVVCLRDGARQPQPERHRHRHRAAHGQLHVRPGEPADELHGHQGGAEPELHGVAADPAVTLRPRPRRGGSGLLRCRRWAFLQLLPMVVSLIDTLPLA